MAVFYNLLLVNYLCKRSVIEVREKVKDEIDPKFKTNLKEIKTPSKRLAFWYPPGNIDNSFHYYVHFGGWERESYAPIYIGLGLFDIDANKNEKAFQLLKSKKEELTKIFGRFDPQISGEKGRKVEEEIPWPGNKDDLSKELLEKVAERLKLYIETLKPMLDELNL